MGLLLDGHHKATACYLEGKPIKCLTIMDVFPYENFNTKESGINYGGNSINYSEIKGIEEIKKFFDKKREVKEDTKYEEVYLEEKYYKPINIDKPKRNFPSYEYDSFTFGYDAIRDIIDSYFREI